MIYFDEEIAKFSVSLEIDQAEDAILNTDITDISDILEKVLSATASGKADKENR